jgi:tetratricopeptide (TPR) repeat protein
MPAPLSQTASSTSPGPLGALQTLQYRLAAALVGASLFVTGLVPGLVQARAETHDWWALGTFVQPLDRSSRREAEDLRQSPRVLAAYESGLNASASGDHKAAVAHFTRAVQLAGEGNAAAMTVYHKLADSHLQLGHSLEALRALDGEIALDPNRPDGYWRRGGVHLQLRDHRKALADYESVAKLSPDTVGAHMNRGLLLSKMSRTGPALEAFEDAIAAATRRYEDIARYWNASVYAKSPPDLVATTLALVRRERDLTIARAHVGRGQVHFSGSSYDAAAAAYGEAILAAPDHELAYKFRGWLNEKRGRVADARADYRKAAAINAADPWIRQALRRVR